MTRRGSRVQHGVEVLGSIAARDDEDHDVLAALARPDGATEVQPRHPGEGPIDQHELERDCLVGGQTFFGGPYRDHIVISLTQLLA